MTGVQTCALPILDGNASVRLNLSQKYQRVGGTITVGGKAQPLLDPRLEGAELQFRYLAPSTGQLTVVKASYTDAGILKGQVGMYSSNGFEGRRVAK